MVFLHGNLEKEIYMTQPCGFKVGGIENHMCRLIKSLYRLKQSSRRTCKRFDQFMKGYNSLEVNTMTLFTLEDYKIELSSVYYSMSTICLYLEE